MSPLPKSYRAGDSIEDFCRACKTDRIHTVVAADAGWPVRVVCDYCRSEHNFRGGPRIAAGGGAAPAIAAAPRREPAPQAAAAAAPIVHERERIAAPMSNDSSQDLEWLLRRIIREEAGVTAVTPSDKWRGGTLLLKPGKPGLQEKSWPIETLFHKVVMVRNRLRTLEQQLNSSDLPEDAKIKLQAYITGCYGSLTSFNILFADEDDKFRGSGGEDEKT
jgi:hypothetical protein